MRTIGSQHKLLAALLLTAFLVPAPLRLPAQAPEPDTLAGPGEENAAQGASQEVAPISTSPGTSPQAGEAPPKKEELLLRLYIGPASFDTPLITGGNWNNSSAQLAVLAENNTSGEVRGTLSIVGTNVRQEMELPPSSRKVFPYLVDFSETLFSAGNPLKAQIRTGTQTLAVSNTVVLRSYFGEAYYAFGLRPGDGAQEFSRVPTANPGGLNLQVFVIPVDPELAPRHPLGYGPPTTLIFYPEALKGLTLEQREALRTRLEMNADRLVFFSRGMPGPFRETLLEPFLPGFETGDILQMSGETFAETMYLPGVEVPRSGLDFRIPVTEFEPHHSNTQIPREYIWQPFVSVGRRAAYIAFDAAAVPIWPSRNDYFGQLDLNIPYPEATSYQLGTAGNYVHQSNLDASIREFRERALPSDNTVLLLVGLFVLVTVGLFILSRSVKRGQPDPVQTFFKMPLLVGAAGLVTMLIVWLVPSSAPVVEAVTYIVRAGDQTVRTSHYSIRARKEVEFDAEGPEGSFLRFQGAVAHPLRASMPKRDTATNRLRDFRLRRNEFEFLTVHETLEWPGLFEVDARSTESLQVRASPRLGASRIDKLESVGAAAIQGYFDYVAPGYDLRPGQEAILRFRQPTSSPYSATPTFDDLLIAILRSGAVHNWVRGGNDGAIIYLVGGKIGSTEGGDLASPLYLNGEPIDAETRETYYFEFHVGEPPALPLTPYVPPEPVDQPGS